MKIKRILLISIVLILLVLDWFALDDITTGNEPNYYGEYAVLAVSVIVFGLIFLWALRKDKTKEVK